MIPLVLAHGWSVGNAKSVTQKTIYRGRPIFLSFFTAFCLIFLFSRCNKLMLEAQKQLHKSGNQFRTTTYTYFGIDVSNC